MHNFWALSLAVLLVFAAGAVVISCGDDDDDDDDDTTDDDGGDDDGGSCETTEAEACEYVVNTCDDIFNFESTAFCEERYEEDCDSGTISDVEGFMTCVCECMDADPACADENTFSACETDCFSTFCNPL
jgi:hypothetical protein